MKQIFKKKRNLIVLSLCFVLTVVTFVVSDRTINDIANTTDKNQGEDSISQSTNVNNSNNNSDTVNENSTIADESLKDDITTTRLNSTVTLPSKGERETTTLKNNNVTSPMTTNSNGGYPPRDLESEYNNKKADLKHEYQIKKNNIEIQRDNDIVNNKSREQDIQTEIRRLQNQCTQEKNVIQQEINELNRKKMEADMMASTNSYYATLSQQYANQIASKQAQLNNIESKYGAKIKALKIELDSIPTTEEIRAQATADLNALEIWYANELEKLNKEYGK